MRMKTLSRRSVDVRILQEAALVYDQHIAHIDTVVRVRESRPIDVLKRAPASVTTTGEGESDATGISTDESTGTGSVKSVLRVKMAPAPLTASLRGTSKAASTSARLRHSEYDVLESDESEPLDVSKGHTFRFPGTGIARRSVVGRRTTGIKDITSHYYSLIEPWPKEWWKKDVSYDFNTFYMSLGTAIAGEIANNKAKKTFTYPAQARLYALVDYIANIKTMHSESEEMQQLIENAIHEFNVNVRGKSYDSPKTDRDRDTRFEHDIEIFSSTSLPIKDILGSYGKDMVNYTFEPRILDEYLYPKSVTSEIRHEPARTPTKKVAFTESPTTESVPAPAVAARVPKMTAAESKSHEEFYSLLRVWKLTAEKGDLDAYDSIYRSFFTKEIQRIIARNRDNGTFKYPVQAILYALSTIRLTEEGRSFLSNVASQAFAAAFKLEQSKLRIFHQFILDESSGGEQEILGEGGKEIVPKIFNDPVAYD